MFIKDWPFDAHCCHMGTAIEHPVPDRVKSYVICNFWHPGTLTIRADGLTRSVTGYFIAVPIWQQLDVKGLSKGVHVDRGWEGVQLHSLLSNFQFTREWNIGSVSCPYTHLTQSRLASSACSGAAWSDYEARGSTTHIHTWRISHELAVLVHYR